MASLSGCALIEDLCISRLLDLLRCPCYSVIIHLSAEYELTAYTYCMIRVWFRVTCM